MSLQFLLLLQVLLLLYISTNGFCASPESPLEESPVMHFKMIHKHDPEILGERKLSHSDRIKDLLHGDKIRREIISYKRKLRRSQREKSSKHGRAFSLPMISGVYADASQYYVPFKIGTPAQEFLLIADTGSDLTWFNCDARSAKHRKGRVFRPEHSNTFKPITCSTKLCQEGLTTLMSIPDECPTPQSPCRYEYTYKEGSNATGVFAYESVPVNLENGSKKTIEGMLIGCTQEWNRPSDKKNGDADGVLGLALSSHSFALNVFKDLRGKFSYCLVDQNSPKKVYNYLTFGHRREEEMPPNMQFTELGNIQEWYAVNVEGVYVNGVKVNVPADVWNVEIENGNGMIIDSGTSLTAFVEDAFYPIIAALEKPLLGKFPKSQFEPFESCFNITNINNRTDPYYFDDSVVPTFEMEFMSKARFRPPVKNYFLETPLAGVMCFGFQSTPNVEEDNTRGVSVLGNVMQQNHLWEFDSFRSRLAFAPSSCLLKHHHS